MSDTKELARGNDASKDTLHPAVVSAFIFNMLLGSGVLTLPYAFQEGGIILASVFLSITAFAAWICANFVLESISLCNYLDHKSDENTSEPDDKNCSDYSIRTICMSHDSACSIRAICMPQCTISHGYQ